MTRSYKASDGKCFAAVAGNECCLILSCSIEGCGTYRCPFYKPEECRNWVRLDGEHGVALLPLGEYFKLYGKGERYDV